VGYRRWKELTDGDRSVGQRLKSAFRDPVILESIVDYIVDESEHLTGGHKDNKDDAKKRKRNMDKRLRGKGRRNKGGERSGEGRERIDGADEAGGAAKEDEGPGS
jgi:hypothetical protein